MKTKELLRTMFDRLRDQNVEPQRIDPYTLSAPSKVLSGSLTFVSGNKLGSKIIHLRLDIANKFPVGQALQAVYAPPNLIEFHGAATWDLTVEHSTRFQFMREIAKAHAHECGDYMPFHKPETAIDHLQESRTILRQAAAIVGAVFTGKLH